MITKQAELKKQAYASALKSRALSILIYLIDRSNQELTCFPAIPTMAEQLHISVSTVKRALKELVEDGYIQKEARSRTNNRGQSSNLYTLIILEQAPTPDKDNTLNYEDNIDSSNENTTATTTTVTHISFATLQVEQQEQTTPDTAPTPCNHAKLAKPQKPVHTAPRTPVQFAPIIVPLFHPLLKQKEKARQLLPCKFPFYRWTGVGFNLQPP